MAFVRRRLTCSRILLAKNRLYWKSITPPTVDNEENPLLNLTWLEKMTMNKPKPMVFILLRV